MHVRRKPRRITMEWIIIVYYVLFLVYLIGIVLPSWTGKIKWLWLTAPFTVIHIVAVIIGIAV